VGHPMVPVRASGPRGAKWSNWCQLDPGVYGSYRVYGSNWYQVDPGVYGSNWYQVDPGVYGSTDPTGILL